MGAKRARKRKRFFFYCTCFLAILLLEIGCAAALNFQKRQQVEKSLEMGEKFIIKGEYEKAISDYNQALRLDPNYVEAYNNRGAAYFFKKEYDKAWEDAYKCQSLGGDNPEILELLHKASRKKQ